MIIENGLVFEVYGAFTKKNIYIQGDRITDFPDACDGLPYTGRIDATDMLVIPGLIDIHLHGCMGHDFCDARVEALDAITEYQLLNGITSLCPTTMTLPEESLLKIVKTLASYENKTGAAILGINMEGPFISPSRAGAQNKEYIRRPDAAMFYRLREAAEGLIRLVDIAPETEGAPEFIEKLSDSVNISLAHTDADYKTAMEAFEKGANHVTHLYNAMPSFSHRNPGVVGAAADCERVYAELITDGIHVDPSVVRATFKIFGDNRIVLISDSCEACGMDDGEYELGGQKIMLCKKTAALKDGTLAGSAANLMDCFRVAVNRMGIPLAGALKSVTINPARSIGLEDRYGSIDVGKKADILVLDNRLEIVHIIKDGKIVK